MCPTFVWGPDRVVTRLVGAVMLAERCVAVIAPSGPGASVVPFAPVRPSGETVMCLWDRSGRGDPANRSAEWRLCMADIEGVI